jgi:hypothetical protein
VLVVAVLVVALPIVDMVNMFAVLDHLMSAAFGMGAFLVLMEVTGPHFIGQADVPNRNRS